MRNRKVNSCAINLKKISTQLRMLFCICMLFVPIVPTSSRAEFVKTLPEGEKIVVIGGALTEIVYALGAQDQIVGRDTTSTYPPEVKAIKDVGYMRALSSEGILSLAPHGILLVEGSGPIETINVLRGSSVPIVEIAENYSFQSVLDKIKAVGVALHKEQQALILSQKINQKLTQVINAVDQIKQKKRVLFVLSAQNGRIMAAGKNTAANGMIELAGGINAIDGYSGYKLLNDEALITAKPDFILSMQNAGSVVSMEELLNMPSIRMTPAGRNRAIYQMDGMFLLGFGPRTADATKELASHLYPSLFVKTMTKD